MKTPVEKMLDSIEYKEVENGGGDNDGVPYVTHEGVLDILGTKLTVYVLNTGQRIFPQEQIDKLFKGLI